MEFLQIKKWNKYNFMFGFVDIIILVSYTPDTKNKNILLFNSMNHDKKIDSNTGELKEQK